MSIDAGALSTSPTSRKKKEKPGKIQLQNIAPQIDCWAVLDTPLDFSFMKLTTPADAMKKTARGVLGKFPRRHDDDDKYDTRCLRLNNNEMASLDGFNDSLTNLLAQPSALGWLDLSFNKLPNIDPVLCQLQRLQILYFHGNAVTELKEVDTLSRCKALMKLSLHGNPIDQNLGVYRLYVLAKLPQLRDLDMTTVSDEDRTQAGRMFPFARPARQKIN